MLVTGWQQALTLLVLLIPGFVYQGLLSRMRGPRPEDRDLSTRIVRALIASALFDLIYVVVLGTRLTGGVARPQSYLDNARSTALWLVTLVFLVPATIAVIQHAIAIRRLYPKLPWKEVFRVYNPTPTAWDFAVGRIGPSYVRVLTKDGGWVGGYAGADSFYTSYPETREIFVEQAWRLNDEGDFDQPVEGSAGRWIKCDDAPVVEFLSGRESDEPNPPGGFARLIAICLVVICWWQRRLG